MGNGTGTPAGAGHLPESLPVGRQQPGSGQKLTGHVGLQLGGAGWASNEVWGGWMEPGWDPPQHRQVGGGQLGREPGTSHPGERSDSRSREPWGAPRRQMWWESRGAGGQSISGCHSRSLTPGSPKIHAGDRGDVGMKGRSRLLDGIRRPPGTRGWAGAWQRGSGAGGSQHLVRVRQRRVEENTAPVATRKHGPCRGQGAAQTSQPPHTVPATRPLWQSRIPWPASRALVCAPSQAVQPQLPAPSPQTPSPALIPSHGLCGTLCPRGRAATCTPAALVSASLPYGMVSRARGHLAQE